MNYYDLNCSEFTRNIDSMLDSFSQDRFSLIIQLINNPNNIQLPISIDNFCLCNMGYSSFFSIESLFLPDSNTELINKPFQCVQCQNINRLVDLHLALDHPFKIEYGTKSGFSLIVHKEPSILGVEVGGGGVGVGVGGGGGVEKNKKYDKFMTNTIISWILDFLSHQQKIPNILRLHTSFICGQHGYYLYDYADLQSLDTIDKIDTIDTRVTYVKDVIKQIIVLVEFLQDDLVYLDYHPSSLLILSNPVSYVYNDIKVKSDFTIKLWKFQQSSMRISLSNKPSVNIHEYSSILELVSKHPFYGSSVERMVKQFQSADEYKITSMLVNNPLILKAILFRHYDLMPTIFNLYGFIMLMLTIPKIREIIFNDPALKNILTPLFTTPELTLIQERLVSFNHKNFSFHSLLSLLENISLKKRSFEIIVKMMNEW